MTDTRRWLERRRRELVARHLTGGGLLTAGLALGGVALGLALGQTGVYNRQPAAVAGAWILVVAALAWGSVRLVRRVRALNVAALARSLEGAGNRRRGSIVATAAWTPDAGSAGLAALADRQVSTWLDADGRRALVGPRRAATRALQGGMSMFALGFVLVALAGPRSPSGREFWNPVALMMRGRGPVTLVADRTLVERGGSAELTVSAPRRSSASLWVRAPGEGWDVRPLALDSGGRATVVLGPLESDRFVRAVSGERASETVRIEVALPLLVHSLELTAEFPTYLERPDEFLLGGPDAVVLPIGTMIRTRGQSSVPVVEAYWRSDRSAVVLTARGTEFSGAFRVVRSGEWILGLRGMSGETLDDVVPALRIVAAPDSAPVVSVPVPGADTTAPLSLRQGILIDARDDHRVRELEVVSWRVSRRGDRSDPELEPVPLPVGGEQRTLASWVLDLNGRGFLPGDTAYYRVQARDNAPVPNVGESPTYVLRLPSMSELRRSLREATRTAGHDVDSLVAAQEGLARQLDDLVTEGERRSTTPSGIRPEGQSRDHLPYNTVERAKELLADEQAVADRAAEMATQLRELSKAAWTAGLTDPDFHRQLREIQDLLNRAVSDELRESLSSLRKALERLDTGAMQDALEQLAEAARQLREELARSRALFERAAVEGELTTMADDADELAQRQDDWTAQLETNPPNTAAHNERALAARSEELARRLAELSQLVDSIGQSDSVVEQARGQATQAGQAMVRAAAQASRSEIGDAGQSGAEAAQMLAPLGSDLRAERDRMRESWRDEVIAALDRAMVESAALAGRENEAVARMQRGESGPDLRGEQAALREGVERVIERLQAAAGRNALVSPRLSTTLGLAKVRMEQAIEQLQRANPNPREAGDLAGQSLDALNEAVHAMVQSRGDVSQAASGSGLAEALERMAQLAGEQGALNGQAGGLIPMLQQGGAQLLEQLRVLAQEQYRLSQDLRRLQAGGEVSAAGELAEDAEAIARDLDGGRLDHQVLERQEQLFRRLLDAGRSLESDEEDEAKERVSEAARPGAVQAPDADQPEGAPRFRYPTWEELRALSPAERRLILDYFRRLNDARP
jgi:hypothetical protein